MTLDRSAEGRNCTECARFLPFESFNKLARGPYGRASKCKDCKREYRARNSDKIREQQRVWQAENAEHVREYSRSRYQGDVGSVRTKQAAYHEANKERISERSREYYLRNAETLRARSREYAAANPDKDRAHQLKRRSQKLGADTASSPTSSGIALLRAWYFTFGCYWCGDLRDTPHMDHWIPLSRGGPHCLENLRPMCPRCNGAKKDKFPEDFFRSLRGGALARPSLAEEMGWR